MQKTAQLKATRVAKASKKTTTTHTKTTKRKLTTKKTPLTALQSKSTHSPLSIQTTPIRSKNQPFTTSLTTRRPRSISKTSLSTPQWNNISTNTSLFNTQKRTLFIQTHSTPNPRSLKFTPGKPVLPEREDGTPTTAFFDQNSKTNARRQCSLAYTLLLLDGVANVMLGSDFVTVTTIDDNQDWMVLKPMVYAAISDAFASDEPILKALNELEPSRELQTLAGDEEAVSLIKEIIDLRIRPTVMDDGGDVEFIQFDKERVVWLLMKGSCSGCPSSGATLKHGIQNMIMHYVPEVTSVEEWKDEAALISDDAFQRLEERLAAKEEKH